MIYTEAQELVRQRTLRTFPIDLGVTTKLAVKYTGKPAGCYTVAVGEHVLRVTNEVAEYLLQRFIQGKPYLIFAAMDNGVVRDCCLYEL